MAPTFFISALRAAIGSDWAATAVTPIAIAATASTVRNIVILPLGRVAPGIPDNPSVCLLFLKRDGLCEPAQDHDWVNTPANPLKMRWFAAGHRGYSAGCGTAAALRNALVATQRHTT